MFPGQASQFVGMGLEVASRWAAADRVFDIADEATGIPVRRLCFQGPEDELVRTANLQPCVVATSIATLAAACEAAGISPDDGFDLTAFAAPPAFVAGHSVGEYSALAATGSLSVHDCLEVIAFRGRAMENAGSQRPGAMLALVAGSPDDAGRLCSDIRGEIDGSYIDIANYNSSDQVVIAGDIESMDRASRKATDYGFRRALPIPVSAAFHSAAMLPAAAELQNRLLAVLLDEPSIPIVGNIGAEPLEAVGSIRHELSAQVASPVRWSESVAYMASHGTKDFFEVGPGQVLSRLINRGEVEVQAVPIGDPTGVKMLADRLTGG